MFNDYDLKQYAARQQEAVNNKYDLALRNALKEEELKSKGMKERQEAINATALEQERMQQEGANTRQSNVIAADAPQKAAITSLYKEQATGAGLSNAFQKAVQPGMIKEVGAKMSASIAQSNRFKTYYSGEQAKDERTAILGGYDVTNDGTISNKENYFDPIFGRGNLQNDLKVLADNDQAISNNKKIKPDPFINLKPGFTRSSLTPYSNGKLPGTM